MKSMRRNDKVAASWISEVVFLFVSYGCAIVLAFILSVFVAASGSVLLNLGFVPFLVDSNPEHRVACFGIAYTAALCGVFGGGIILANRKRILACLALTTLGIGYYYAWWGSASSQAAIPTAYPLLLPLILGGLSAAPMLALLPRKNRKARGTVS